MTRKEMIAAWKNPEARSEGLQTPVGNIELNENDLDSVAGGNVLTDWGCPSTTNETGCSKEEEETLGI